MINITKDEARKYLFKYQNLYHPRKIESDEEILNFIRKVGCIQYDPLKTTARNADLVLQSRCKNYSEYTLYHLLYEKRQLLDGWDKNMSIWSVDDWPYFERIRKGYREKYDKRTHELKPVREIVTRMIERDGYASSKDINDNKKVEWSWAPTSIARATLESMYHCGELVIHHKKGTRKCYGLPEKLLPLSILNEPDPNTRLEEFREWYVKRRIGSIGLLWNKSSDAWLGSHLKKEERTKSIKRLIEKEQITEINIIGIGEPFYLAKKDLEILNDNEKFNEASLIAPLDNLIWDRKLILELFDFDYKWEVYTPVGKRKYGYYVLPIIYKESFIGRCEPIMDHKNRELVIKDWWWEKDIVVNQDLTDALVRCFRDFAGFLDAKTIVISNTLSEDKLKWIKDCV